MRYAMLMRPPCPGVMPREGLLSAKEADLTAPSGHHAWGIIEYSRTLTEKEVTDYELEPVPYCGSVDGCEIEPCANCGHEIELRWDINKSGFHAFCPVCGHRLMLCDACMHRTGAFHDDCDYHSGTDSCRFSRPEGWWRKE